MYLLWQVKKKKNRAEIDPNRSEFESLAESIIDYIDEIARRNK